MPDIFISPERVVSNRDDFTLVDVSREWDYEEEHVPSAVNVPFEAFRDPTDETEGKLPTAHNFAALLGEAGIESNDRIIAYDGDFGVYASRFLVTAEVFGHSRDRLYLLDGDITTWARKYETSATIPRSKPTDYTCTRTEDTPLVTAMELDAALDTDAIVVDTRGPVEYDTVHLPNAVNVRWRDLVDEDPRRLKSRDELSDVLAEQGITPGRPVRLYCNTARRSSFVYAVLRELGYGDIAFFEGGIGAWTTYGGSLETS